MSNKTLIGLLVFCAVVLCGCRPKGILHSWEMRAVMVDLHKTDALIQIAGLQHKDQEIKNIYYAQVLEKHGITQAEFDSSLVWYTAHPQLFNKIYPKVIKELKSEEEQFLALHEAELSPKKFDKEDEPVLKPILSAAQLDSIYQVIFHGYASMWDAPTQQTEQEVVVPFLP